MNSHAASWRLSSRVRSAQPSMTRPLAAIERPANMYCDAGPLSSHVDTSAAARATSTNTANTRPTRADSGGSEEAHAASVQVPVIEAEEGSRRRGTFS